MPTPDGFIDFEGLILRVAVEAGLAKFPTGVADNRSKIPTDPNVLDRIKRAINDSRQEIYRRASTMTCFRPRISFTTVLDGSGATNVLADPAKYLMPMTARAIAIGRWQWTAGTDTQGWGGDIIQKHEGDIARLHANVGSTASGPPQLIALCKDLVADPAMGGRKRHINYLWLYPVPDAEYTISGQVQLMYAPLSELGDVDPMGDEHALTIIEGAHWQLRKSMPDSAANYQKFVEAIALSKKVDADRRPQSIGVSHDPDSVHKDTVFSPFESDVSRMVSHVNGIPVL